MSASIGRNMIVRRGASPRSVVAAGRSKSLTLNAEPVDLTSDDDDGVRTLLETEAGQKSADMSFEGVSKNSQFLQDITGNNFVDDYEIEISGVGVFTGRFFVTSVNVTGPYNDATTFSAEFQSTGAWTFTPSSP